LIKADPGKYNYASSGIGTPSHLTAELFRSLLNLNLVHVPFNAAGPSIASTLGATQRVQVKSGIAGAYRASSVAKRVIE
jgi:tripartite-type tricarboxylate transporter receptor subunit TctC